MWRSSWLPGRNITEITGGNQDLIARHCRRHYYQSQSHQITIRRMWVKGSGGGKKWLLYGLNYFMSWPLSIGFDVVSTRRENVWRKYLNVKKLYASFRDPGAPDEPSLPPPRVVLSIIIQKPIYACITPPPCLYTPLALATLPTTQTWHHFEEANIIIGFCLWQQQSCLTRKAW